MRVNLTKVRGTNFEGTVDAFDLGLVDWPHADVKVEGSLDIDGWDDQYPFVNIDSLYAIAGDIEIDLLERDVDLDGLSHDLATSEESWHWWVDRCCLEADRIYDAWKEGD